MSLPAKTLCINPNKLFYKDNNLMCENSQYFGYAICKVKKIINKNKDRKEYYLKRHISKSYILK